MTESNLWQPGANPDDSPPAPVSAITGQDRLAREIGSRRRALFLDYDGTLTPIVRRPEEALLPEETRDLLRQLAGRFTVAIVSGRDRADVEHMVGLERLIYAGSHGFDIRGPNVSMQHAQAVQALPDLDAAEQQLQQRLQTIRGARVERKKFAIAVHYREVEDAAAVVEVKRAVEEAQRRHPVLRMMAGRKVFELQPDVDWNKGRAVRWLCDTLGRDPSEDAILYVGDDVTDEDAFRVLAGEKLGIGIRVAPEDSGTCAPYFVRDTEEVKQLLRFLLSTTS